MTTSAEDATDGTVREQGAGRAFTQGYQDTVVRLRDDFGYFVRDSFLEVFCNIRLGPDWLRKLFQPDRTVLADLTLRREQTDKEFRLLPLG